MIVVLPESAGSLACLKFIGKISDGDFTDVAPKLEHIIAEHGSLRLFADLTEFDGWEWIAAWDKAAFGIKHWGDIVRIALTGDNRWEDLSAKIAGRVMPAEVKYFASDERDDALEWVDSPLP